MNIKKMRILGSNYAGLFCVTNDNLCFVPHSIEEKALKEMEKTLEVKAVKAAIYGSALLAVFSKMNNKKIFLPSYVSETELEIIEREIKATVLETENALGNLIELNDTGAIVSKTLPKRIVDDLKKTGLTVEQTNIAKTEVVGSSILATNKGFLINPKASKEEAAVVQKVFGVKGGSSSANTGDLFVRNSVIANSKGIILGENTTPYEINKIEEALLGE